MLRLSLFHGAIWCFSASEIGHFASWNGAFCNTKKCPLNISYWYSILYNKLFISHICVRWRVLSQIRAYFSGYIGKLGGKNQNPVINWKSSILISFKHKKTIIHEPREMRSEWIKRITAWSQSGEWRIRYGELCIRIRRVVYQNTDNSVSEPGEWSIITQVSDLEFKPFEHTL